MDGHVIQLGEKINMGKNAEGSHLEVQERYDRTLQLMSCKWFSAPELDKMDTRRYTTALQAVGRV